MSSQPTCRDPKATLSAERNDYLVLQPMPQSRRYVVVRSWRHLRFVIPEGFQTDGASMPRFLWPFMGSPFMPQFIEAAVLHDFNYKTEHASRRLADHLFYKMLMEDGVGRIRARLMWMGVRAFGWIFYGRDDTP